MSVENKTNKNFFYFDDVSVDGENFCLQKDGQNLTLTPRAFDVLFFLLKHNDRVVEKQEIFDSVWKDTFVSDNALAKIIKEIRHTLKDSAETPHYIETIPKRGYRFIGNIKPKPVQTSLPGETNFEQIEPIEEVFQPTSPKNSSRFAFSGNALTWPVLGLILVTAIAAGLWFRSKSVTTAPIRSIAVLPFKPLNAESRDESLEMGMAETLITRLSNLNQIVVRPMSAVRKYTDLDQDSVKAGQEVQAEAVLEGSIQKVGERVRVTVRLTDVRQGTTLWSEQFDENFTDIFKVQDSIAERIATALTPQLSRQEKELLTKHQTNNTEAYQLYLRGQLIWHGRRENWISQSLSYNQQALEKDPNFALAYIGIADCYIMLSGHRRISMQEAEIKARPQIMKALEIDDNLAQAHNALAELKYQYDYDWEGAEKEFRRAIELNPNVAWIHQAYGWFLMSKGHFEEADREMGKAQQLDPSSLTINVGKGRLYYYSRQYDQALEYFQNLIAVEPNDSSLYLALVDIYEQKKMYPEAFETQLKFLALKGVPPEKLEAVREVFRNGGWEALLRHQLDGRNDKDEASFGLADLYARLGEKDKAFACFKKVFDAKDPALLQFKIEPAYDLLRDDPRYAQLLHKIGLEP